MAVSCRNVIKLIEEFAPLYMAEKWDNVGLQIGSPDQEINKIFLTLDLNIDVLEEAVSAQADMLVVHHTPFFKAVKGIRTDLNEGKLISEIIKKNMVLYAAHTNLDSTFGGVNDILAAAIDLKEIKPLDTSWRQKLYKLVVFVPSEHISQVRGAINAAGAGHIGNYSDCSFSLQGTGQFKPQAGTNPYIGRQGVIEQVEEIRLETIVPEERLKQVIDAMHKVHPYEEVAYDLYLLENMGQITGLGRIGVLPEPVLLQDFLSTVKNKLGFPGGRYCGDNKMLISKVALCGGSAAFLIPKAAALGAQVFLTGDVKYHEAQDAVNLGIAVVDAGHYYTEVPVIKTVAKYLQDGLKQQGVEITVSQKNTDPFIFF